MTSWPLDGTLSATQHLLSVTIPHMVLSIVLFYPKYLTTSNQYKFLDTKQTNYIPCPCIVINLHRTSRIREYSAHVVIYRTCQHSLIEGSKHGSHTPLIAPIIVVIPTHHYIYRKYDNFLFKTFQWKLSCHLENSHSPI